LRRSQHRSSVPDNGDPRARETTRRAVADPRAPAELLPLRMIDERQGS
jgi:hypothetical protein